MQRCCWWWKGRKVPRRPPDSRVASSLSYLLPSSFSVSRLDRCLAVNAFCRCHKLKDSFTVTFLACHSFKYIYHNLFWLLLYFYILLYHHLPPLFFHFFFFCQSRSSNFFLKNLVFFPSTLYFYNLYLSP